jgi:hypothetical protein
VSAGRVKGPLLYSKSKGRGQLSIRWELGIRDDGYVPGQVTHAISDLCKVSTFKGKFLSDPKFAFTLEAYTNGTPAPNILPKESNRVLQSIIDYDNVNQASFRNHVTRRVLESIIFSLSRFAVNGTTFRVRVLE